MSWLHESPSQDLTEQVTSCVWGGGDRYLLIKCFYRWIGFNLMTIVVIYTIYRGRVVLA